MESFERSSKRVSIIPTLYTGADRPIYAQRNLANALEAIGWPRKINYPSLSVDVRKNFERAFRELLQFQQEYVWLIYPKLSPPNPLTIYVNAQR